MVTDPVQTIKDEESKATRQIEELTQENRSKLEEYQIKKEKELNEYKEELREKGQAALEKAKQEAMDKFKVISMEEERDRAATISRAKTQKEETINKIVSSFEKTLVS